MGAPALVTVHQTRIRRSITSLGLIPASTGTIRLRFGDIDRDLSTIQLRAVQASDGFLRLVGAAHRDEAESTRFVRGPIHDDLAVTDGAMRAKRVLKLGIGRLKRETPNE
jgi:hypothetical protein